MLQANGFDKLARVYRLLEYASFGPLLWKTRTACLPQLCNAQRALILGDGDGRFTAALLHANSSVHVVAVDASRTMLDGLRARVAAQGHASRLQVIHADATTFQPGGSFDLVCTHFFLDCLHNAEVNRIVGLCASHLSHKAQWVVSEFAVPPGIMRVPAWLLVRLLYLAFGGLTGLRVRRLPDYAAVLQEAGFVRVGLKCRLFGALRSERWQLNRTVDPHS